LRHFVQTAVNEVFDWDSKLVTTLKMLVFKPGQLSKDYLEGRRVAHIHPVRLYIVISALFIVIGSGSILRSEFQLNIAESGIQTSALREATENVRQNHPGLSKQELEDLAKAQSMKSNPRLRKYLRQIRQRLDGRYRQFDDLLSSNVRILSPVTALILPLFLMLVFKRNHLYYVQHLTFSIHYFCFSFVVSMVAAILIISLTAMDLQAWVTLVAALQMGVLIFYFHRANRRVYAQAGGASWWRTLGALSFIFVLNMAIKAAAVGMSYSHLRGPQ